MKINTDHLITVSNYARRKGKATATIYNKLKDGSLKGVEIDDVKFVISKDKKK